MALPVKCVTLPVEGTGRQGTSNTVVSCDGMFSPTGRKSLFCWMNPQPISVGRFSPLTYILTSVPTEWFSFSVSSQKRPLCCWSFRSFWGCFVIQRMPAGAAVCDILSIQQQCNSAMKNTEVVYVTCDSLLHIYTDLDIPGS